MNKDINRMNYDELRDEVQRLRDDIFRMKKLLTDTLQNLGEENFNSQIIKEKDEMKTQITVTAEKIESTVSKTDLENSLSNYTTIKQTANAISTLASKSAELAKAEPIPDLSKAVDTSKIYVIQEKNEDSEVVSETYYYFNDLSKKWEILSGDSIYTVFEQTPEGFSLKGNVVIDGNAVVTKDLTLSGNVKWEMENSPVKTRYSSDGVSWEVRSFEDGDMYMQMSFDGGATWSKSTKVVGTDGKPGSNGSDANVTDDLLFGILTNDGAELGMFPFYSDATGKKLFINASYINSGTIAAERIDTENLACTRIYAKDNPNGYYAKMASSIGDFGIYENGAGEYANPTNPKCIWGVFHSDEVSEVVNFYSYGDVYMGHRASDNAIFAKGKWDFANCSSIVWGDNAPVAVFGGD